MRSGSLRTLCSKRELLSGLCKRFNSTFRSERQREGSNGLKLVAGTFLLCGLATSVVKAQSLQLSYGASGLQTLRYNGVLLEDVSANPGDAFHIWHMKATDMSGNVVSSGQYGWGENNNGTSWDSATQTKTYWFQWGSIRTRFVQSGNNLDVVVTMSNNANSGIVFDGAEIYPLALHFPQEPKNFYGYSQTIITNTAPGVSAADFGSGVVTAVIPDESIAMYGGWKAMGNMTYSPQMTTTSPDGLATFLPKLDHPVQPGSSFTYTTSLRFTPEGTPADASDAYASFAKMYPNQLNWTDRRVIGTAYLASSPAGNGDKTLPGGFPTNPRRYFNDQAVDVTTAGGLRAFQDRLLAQAASNVANARMLNSQGVITWDLEGEQYPMDTSYVCSPDQIASVAPEMESTVQNPASAFYGQRLDDAYFKTMTQAGLRVGVCIRPQAFVMSANGTASQNFLSSNSAIVANLENKARFANARWGVSIFYVDSNVDINGGTLDPAIFQQLITDLPNFLFIPEESTPRYYAYSAPFRTFLFHGDLGTDQAVYNYYPNAFSANLINDVSAAELATAGPSLIQAVAKGDVLMGHADWWQPNNPTLLSIYQAAGKGSLPPVQVTPVVQWPTPSPITYGTALSATQLNAAANTTGTFVYAPGAGAILNAGSTKLLVSFTPADLKSYTTATASVNLEVAQATPMLTWGTPGDIVQGTALSVAQLNATASVAGTFSYSPAAGTVLNTGLNTLRVTFTPSDPVNYAVTSATTSVNVSAKPAVTPTLTWAPPAAITYGTPLSAAQLNASSNVAGTFTYSPSLGTTPSAGLTALTVTFTPTDKTSYTSAVLTVNLTVTPVVPSITWRIPASISQGTALSSAQLNASANVPGTFAYAPSTGTVLGVGTNMLTCVFTPNDAVNYTSASAAVTVLVTPKVQIAPTVAWSTPSAIAYGTALTSQQLNAAANVSGSFTYAPAPGSVLAAGRQVLTATFTPSDQTTYSVVTRSVILTVNKAVPVLAWATPAAITQGVALSSAQLNATANVSGSFAYTPASGMVPGAGTQKLVTVFTPADSANYNVATATTMLTVNAASVASGPLYITSPAAGGAVSGVITVSGQCTLALDAAGTFLMVDGQPLGTRRVTSGPFLYGLDTRTLSNGIHSLQLWGHDIGDRTTISPAVQVLVQN